MKEIYSKATSVIVWLGPPREDSTKAIQSLAILASIYKNDVRGRFAKAWQAPRNEEEHAHIQYIFEALDCGLNASHSIALMPIEALMNRAWWKRVWTLQEVILAWDFTTLCGATCLGAFDLRNAALVLRVFSFVGNSSGIFTLINRILDNYEDVIRMWSAYRARERLNLRMDLTLLNLLERASGQNRTCTDARDHVFGLLGIAQDSSVTRIRTDYHKSVVTVYTEVAKVLILRYGLDVLAYCHIPNDCAGESGSRTGKVLEYSTHRGETQTSNSYPSWVPQWDTNPEVPFRGSVASEYPMVFCASNCTQRGTPPISVHNNLILECVGSLLDEINDILGYRTGNALTSSGSRLSGA